jgi:hypothetical protein
MDVNAVLHAETAQKLSAKIEEQAAENIKRVVARGGRDWLETDAENPYLIRDTQEVKTTWHPVGI